MKTYNIGIAGLGFAGMAQLKAFTNSPRTQVTAAWTPSTEKLKRVAAENGISTVCEDFEGLLDAGLDVLVVCTPDHLHTDYAAAGLEANINVLCEKPLVTTLADAKKLVQLVNKTGKIFMTGQCARFFARSHLARSLVDQGELGTIFFAESDYIHDCVEFLRDWRIDPAAPQNMVLGGGCHPVDLLRSLLGDVDEVHAVANKMAFSPTNPIEHDCMLLSLKFRSGAIGKVLISIGCKRPYSLGLSLYGDQGTLVDEKLFLGKIPGLSDFMPVPIDEHSHDENNVFDQQAAHLVECLDEGKQPMADVLEGAKNVATCIAGIESIETGRPVRVVNEF